LGRRQCAAALGQALAKLASFGGGVHVSRVSHGKRARRTSLRATDPGYRQMTAAGPEMKWRKPRCRCTPNDLDPRWIRWESYMASRLSARGGHAQQPM
jgi:hypothetical protein